MSDVELNKLNYKHIWVINQVNINYEDWSRTLICFSLEKLIRIDIDQISSIFNLKMETMAQRHY